MLLPFAVRAPSGAWLHGLANLPLRRRAPCVVLVPGGVGAGRTMARGPLARALAADGVAAVSFNAEGRVGARGDLRSGGAPDFNGPRDQDGLAGVVRLAARLPGVDPERIGIYSVSYGLVAAAGAIARHPDLPVRWIVDEEGPDDAYAAMLHAWRLVDLGERPDRAQKADDLFPLGCPDGSSGPRAAYWREREPVRQLPAFRGRYLRLQAEWDHVQPPQEPAQVGPYHRPPRWWLGKHAVALQNAAIDGGVPWVRVNLPAQGNPPNRRYGPETPPVWLPGRMADHPDAARAAIAEMIAASPSVSR